MALVQWVSCIIKIIVLPPPLSFVFTVWLLLGEISPPEDPSERLKQNKKYRTEGYGISAKLMRVSRLCLFPVIS